LESSAEILNTSTVFPAINASLNSLSLVFLIWGYILVRQKNYDGHKKVMIGAFAISALFLASYLYYHFNYSSGRFQGTGLIRPIYFFILISHIILAVFILPFIFRMLWLAAKERFTEHRKIARWVWPLWVYTSATGVLVYLMLYQWFAVS